MENKFLKFGEGVGLNDLKALTYWISSTHKRIKKYGINLHGEANYMTNE